VKRSSKITGGVLAAAALTAGGIAVAKSNNATTTTNPAATTDAANSTKSPATRATAKVERKKLGKETRYNGTLKYDDSRTFTTPAAAGATAGSTRTVTSIIGSGATLDQGTVVYGLDTLPTVTLYGTKPMYRPLARDSAPGADIRQLEQNLVELGYDPDRKITIDDVYDDATVSAVNRWAEALGVTVDGKVPQSRVVFIPGKSVVSKVSASVGGQVTAGSSLVDAVVTESKVAVNARAAGKVGNVNAGDQPAAGDVLYELDGVSVITLLGDQQITRALKEGDTGTDVRVLQENLIALGYGTGKAAAKSDKTTTTTTAEGGKTIEKLKVNGTYDTVTRQAVERLQFDTGKNVTGSLAAGEVVVLPRGYKIATRIDTAGKTDNKAAVKRNDELFTLMKADRVVTLDVVLADKDKVKVGTSTRIAVPGSEDLTGTVRSVSPVAVNPGTGTAKKDATVTATISTTTVVQSDQIELPVDVYVNKVLATDALAVPVSAIVAKADGSFAVEKTDGTSVSVKTGETADNFIEITGEGVEEGMEVIVP
jgi:peptidoglycan hydrolase-like protein with peptidoglycan-binding domain